MRRLFLASLFPLALAACEQRVAPEPTEPEIPAIVAAVTISDQLPNLEAPATGIAFWEHPTLPFNGMMIVTSAIGVVTYNIEDGNEVGRAPGVNLAGAAVSYAGFGAQAAGILATLDVDENLFRFYGISNTSRTLLPIEGGPEIRGNVRGFCFGRSQEASAPTLFVVQNSKLTIFNFDASDAGLVTGDAIEVATADNLTGCAVDADGVVLLNTQEGDVYRLAAGEAAQTPFASLDITNAGDLEIAAATDESGALTGIGLLLNKPDGAVHVFDRNDGRAIGVVTVAASQDFEGVSSADVIGVSTSNLGGLYRNGVVAFGTESEDGPLIRLIPVNGVLNALSLTLDEPLRPRGTEPEADNDLIIDISIETPQ